MNQQTLIQVRKILIAARTKDNFTWINAMLADLDEKLVKLGVNLAGL